MSDFKRPKRDYSTFDLSHMHRTSGDMGKLIPLSTKTVYPGDKFKVSVDAFVRGMPTIAPIVDKIDLKINHFFVPYRVLWDKWQQFYTKSNKWKVAGGVQPKMPTLKTAANPSDPKYPNGRLADYLGVSPTYIGANVDPTIQELSAMPWLAYHKIFLDYFAPQRWVNYLQANDIEHKFSTLERILEQVRQGNGGNIGTIGENHDPMTQMHNVGWNHDYLTNALPTPTLFDDAKLNILRQDIPAQSQYLAYAGGTYGLQVVPFNPMATDYNPSSVENANRNNSVLATVRDLRKSIAVQHYLEQMSYGGGRYMETLSVLWGTTPNDQTLQRSEYLGGDVLNVFVNEVESSANTTGSGGSELGDLAGKPIGGGHGSPEYFEAEEHGIYMCLAHIVPKRSYSDAMDKSLFFQNDIDEMPNPEMEGIGDEPVYLYEVTGKNFNLASANQIFGYVPRYSYLKTSLPRFSGEMRHSLKQWHLGSTAEELQNYTTISPEFIECNPREDIFVTDEPDKFLISAQINITAQRKFAANPMPGMSYI